LERPGGEADSGSKASPSPGSPKNISVQSERTPLSSKAHAYVPVATPERAIGSWRSVRALQGRFAQAPTTVMMRNLPYCYTRQMLIDLLDSKGLSGKYDFIYLPIDFNSKCNVGYAFINFRTAASAQRFIQEFHGTKTKHCLPGFSSEKVAEVSYGRVQGRDQNMENLRDEKFIEKLAERPEWQPLFLDDHGKEIPFSKTFGAGNKKRGKSSATPTHMIPPTTPTGFFSPYGQMPYPMYGMPPPAPPTTLASVLPTASVTTILMLRGVPAAYTRTKMLEFLNSKYSGTFDFLFIPGEAKK